MTLPCCYIALSHYDNCVGDDNDDDNNDKSNNSNNVIMIQHWHTCNVPGTFLSALHS